MLNLKSANQKPPPKIMNSKPSLKLFLILLVPMLAFALPANGQMALSGTNYTQNFDQIASGLPTGWSVRTNATATSLGTAATFNPAAVSWATATGQFGNQASTTNNSGTEASGGESSTQEAAFTNRCPAIRQGASFGDPGAAFVFQITNTIGLSNLTFSIDLNMLNVQTHSTTWTIDYAVGNSPGSFTTLGTYPDPGAFGTTTRTFSLGTDANNQSQNISIRIVALTASTGSSGSRDTFGIDNFILNYAGPSTTTISSEPASRTNAVLSTATFAVVASGNPPFYYQWFDGTNALVDGENISGSTNDTLTLSNLLHTNAGNYTVVITNDSGSVTSSVAKLTIVGFAIAPLSATNVLAGMPVTVPLSFIDNQTAVTSVSGSSSNQFILPDAHISGTAAGDSGMVTLTPLAGTNGVVLVNLIASDGNFSTNASFALMVVPSTNVVFNDHFDYANGSVTINSLGLWRNYGGPAGQCVVTNGALRISLSFDEDVDALLIGQPFETNSPAALYSRFTVTFSTLPTATGNYFAHFKDAGLGLAASIWASTANTIAPNTFRLGIGNATTSTAATAQFPVDLNTNVSYTVVTRLVLSNGVSTLWINPTSESDPSVTANDAVTNLLSITSYAFREDGSEGKMLVDDLAVATTFNDLVSSTPAAAFLQIRPAVAKVVLTWTNSSFALQAAPAVNGAYTNVPGATSPFTNAIDRAKKFYRLVH